MTYIKRSLTLFLCILTLAVFAAETRAKYVFLMIGDGMGDAIRELYQRQCGPGALGTFAINIPTGTNNVDNKTTDSAASGTAIACGIKTRNLSIGVNADGVPVTSLAKILRDSGYKIGLVSSVGINDATPGAHYGNRARRNERMGVLSDMFNSRFHFFGIDTILYPPDYKTSDPTKFPAEELARRGYKIARDKELFQLEPGGYQAVFTNLDPIWSNKPERATPSLAEITREAARLLKNDRGFFLMVEGGSIDTRAHHNDSPGVVREMIEFDAAVAAALAFQQEHPTETLVVVTADHDTGGIVFTPDKTTDRDFYMIQTRALVDIQKSLERKKKSGTGMNELIDYCCAQVGLSDPTESELAKIRDAAKLFLDGKSTSQDSLTGYGRYNPLAIEVARARDARQGLAFTTFGHTDRKITTNVRGVGETLFNAPLENSDIPHKIAIAMLGSNEALVKGAQTPPLPPPEP